jgi:hypothetical protein
VRGNRDLLTYGRNLVYASVAGQVGCMTVVVLLGALLLGMWLDSLAGIKGVFTIGLLLASVPVSLYLVTRMALRAAAAIRQEPSTDEKNGVSSAPTVKED